MSKTFTLCGDVAYFLVTRGYKRRSDLMQLAGVAAFVYGLTRVDVTFTWIFVGAAVVLLPEIRSWVPLILKRLLTK